jgi:hypothetical protein
MEPVQLLGPAHPLTRVMRERAVVARHALTVTMLLAAALTASLNGVAWAVPGAAGAAGALAGLSAFALVLRMRAHEEAREPIAGGGEELPLPPVERERRRLLAERTRASLAASLERLSARADARLSRFAAPVPGPLYDLDVLREVADELRSTAEVLRAGPASARGIALTEQLLMWGGSSLYGDSPMPLRTDLGRVRYLLEQRS